MACVEKRGKGYRITVYDGYDENGRQIKRHKCWTPTSDMTDYQIKKELERQKVLFEEECKDGRIINHTIKFKEFAEKWFNEYAISHLRITTLSTYRDLSKRVYSSIGHLRLDHIKPSTLNKFYLELQGLTVNKSRSFTSKVDLKSLLSERELTYTALATTAGVALSTVKTAVVGRPISRVTATKIATALVMPFDEMFQPSKEKKAKLAAKTVHHYHGFLSSVLERAVKWGYIPDNPCKRVDLARLRRIKIDCLTKDEARILLKNLNEENTEKQALFYTLLFTGVRRGELLGLEWSDIDFEKRTLTIQRSSLYTRSNGLFTDTTKNESSKRTISISDELIYILKKHQQEQNKMREEASSAWIASNRLFTEWNGAPMSTNKPYNMLRRLLKKYGLPPVSLHSLRHTNATIMIESGTDISTTAERLGHSQTSTTMNIYVHQIQSSNEHAAVNISKALAFA